jgi:hypothetical protein
MQFLTTASRSAFFRIALDVSPASAPTAAASPRLLLLPFQITDDAPATAAPVAAAPADRPSSVAPEAASAWHSAKSTS